MISLAPSRARAQLRARLARAVGRVGLARGVGRVGLVWPFGVAVLALGAASCGVVGGGGSEADEAASPLASYLGQEAPTAGGPAGAETGAEERFVTAERERQDLIAACMAAQGFDYQPLDSEAVASYLSPPAPADGQPERGSTGWIAIYGFGITTTWFTQEEVGPDLVGRPAAIDTPGIPGTGTPGPGTEAGVVPGLGSAVASLSPAEQEAYLLALFGAADVGFDGTTADPLSGGCWSRALDGGDDVAATFFRHFGQEVEAIYRRADDDERVLQARAELSACVGQDGLDYPGTEAVRRRFTTELAGLEGAISHPADELTEDDFATLSNQELTAILSQPRSLDPQGLATLGRLQAEEVALAVAVEGCGGPVDHAHPVFQEVLRDHQRQFLVDNEDRLAELERSEHD